MNTTQNTTTAKEGGSYPPALIHIHLLPENTHFDLPRVKTAAQLLAALGCPLETAIVARGQELLTPDRQIWPDDSLMVRKVMSMG
jgi:sulfur carrier protein